jgi:hypothetical protein
VHWCSSVSSRVFSTAMTAWAAKFYETELMPMLCTPLWTWPPHVVELRSIGTENISK